MNEVSTRWARPFELFACTSESDAKRAVKALEERFGGAVRWAFTIEPSPAGSFAVLAEDKRPCTAEESAMRLHSIETFAAGYVAREARVSKGLPGEVQYDEKTDRVVYGSETDGFGRADWLRLAQAALDQAGLRGRTERGMHQVIGEIVAEESADDETAAEGEKR